MGPHIRQGEKVEGLRRRVDDFQDRQVVGFVAPEDSKPDRYAAIDAEQAEAGATR